MNKIRNFFNTLGGVVQGIIYIALILIGLYFFFMAVIFVLSPILGLMLGTCVEGVGCSLP